MRRTNLMRKLTKQDIEDILHGCTILGTGGGGDLEEGYEYVDEALEQGKEFILVDVDEVPDDALICTPYLLGSVSPLTEKEEKQYKRLPRTKEKPILQAFKRLEQYTKKNFYGAISCELGGANTAVAFYVAAMMDGYIIDADPAGRAVPEITHSTYYINGLPAAPIVMANEFGECAIIENVIDDQRAEDLVRALAIVSRNNISAIDHALEMKVLRQAVIKGAISYALALGKVFREARQNGLDVIEKVAETGNGFVAFKGQVKMYEWKTESGFTIGDVVIDGVGRYEHHQCKIDYKNEHMVSRLDNKIHCTIPELICLFDLDTQKPITNPNHKVGMKVAVVILPAPKEFTTEKGLQAFGPQYLELSIDYRPAQDMF